ncbi:DUF1496 domain-containing protein [Aeromonas crassostreae]
MKSVVVMLALLGLTLPAMAEPSRHTIRAGTDLVLPLGAMAERICWYEGQQYSLGARIPQGEHGLICAPINLQESNGPLAWRPLQEEREGAAPPAGVDRIETPR